LRCRPDYLTIKKFEPPQGRSHQPIIGFEAPRESCETWRIVQPLLDAPPPIEFYQPGSWGPPSADKLLAGHPAWREPWLS
jgi:hypothetical protein